MERNGDNNTGREVEMDEEEDLNTSNGGCRQESEGDLVTSEIVSSFVRSSTRFDSSHRGVTTGDSCVFAEGVLSLSSEHHADPRSYAFGSERWDNLKSSINHRCDLRNYCQLYCIGLREREYLRGRQC